MRLGSVRMRRSVLASVLTAAAAGCHEASTAPKPTLTVRNDTDDTLLYSIVEREFGAVATSLGFRDTLDAITNYAHAPGSVWSNSTENIWAYTPGAALRFTLYRVSGTRVTPGGSFDVTAEELARSKFFVAIPASALTR